MPTMTILQVGKPYPGVHGPIPQVARYQYDRGGHTLILSYDRPTPDEIAQVRAGPIEFAAYWVAPVLLMLFRVGDGPWSDAPYSWHLVSEERRDLPEVGGGHALVQVVLLDTTGIVRATRVVSLSPAFTAALHLHIRAQAQLPWSEAEFVQGVHDAQIFTCDELVALAFVRSMGGE